MDSLCQEKNQTIMGGKRTSEEEVLSPHTHTQPHGCTHEHARVHTHTGRPGWDGELHYCLVSLPDDSDAGRPCIPKSGRLC